MNIAIASGKGGTGKTMVSVNLAHTLRSAGIDVTLADCDAEEPNSCTFFRHTEGEETVVTQKVPVIDTERCTFCGRCHEYCNYNAIFILPPANFIQVIEDLCHGCGACTVACRDQAISEKDVVLGKVSSYTSDSAIELREGRMKVGVFSPVNVIKATVRAVPETGVNLFDSPPGTSCPFIQTVAPADYVILVSEPTPFGLSDLRQSVATLRQLDKPFGVVINRAGLGSSDIYTYLRQEGIEELMEIPFSREIAGIYASGGIFTEHRTEWQDKFLDMYKKIERSYGDSSHQR